MSQEHFIKDIEIKNFKLFKDFKAEGFGRINLIGGKNNVGKTAFMEACYLSQSDSTEELFGRLLEIKTHRDYINLLLNRNDRKENLHKLIKDNINIEIYIKGKGRSEIDDELNYYSEWIDGLIKIEIENNQKIKVYNKYTKLDVFPPQGPNGEELSYPNIYTISELVNTLDIFFYSTKYRFSLNFISPYSNSNKELENIIGDLKLNKKYAKFNSYLKEVFNIDSIDIIKDKPMLEVKGSYLKLAEFGQGVKSFINIISSLLLLNKNFLFIDEIENGIHYTNLDKLWEIILTISKEQNVQVFATTHSKECIESYARVAKKLEDEEIKFIELGKDKENKIRAIVRDADRFYRDLEVGNEVRGW